MDRGGSGVPGCGLHAGRSRGGGPGSYLAGAIWPRVLQGLFDTYGWRIAFESMALYVLCTMVPLAVLLYPRARHLGKKM